MSSNLISLPLKATLPVPLATSLIDLIASTSLTTHPDQIAGDARVLEQLRTDAVGKQGDGGSVDALSLYYQHLTFSLSKLPLSPGVPLPWYPLFTSPSSPLSLGSFTSSAIEHSHLGYERANVLLNLAAGYSALANEGRRNEGEGMKVVIGGFQNAAGALSHLLTLLPSLVDDEGLPLSPDLTAETVESLRDLMLAQAQEVFWQKGVMDRLKNGTISKLALSCSTLYGSSLSHAMAAKTASFSFPEALTNHLTLKQLHFGAVAQYRKSIDDLGANRYGDELGRLEIADGQVKKALASSKRGVADSVLRDLKGLQSTLTDNLSRARKDNSLIYLESPTPSSSLPAIIPSSLARPTTPPALSPLPPTAAATRLFKPLQPYIVHQALALYLDRRASLLSSALTQPAEQFSALEGRTLSALGLPASLDALQQPVGLPPSLKARAEEVRSEGGVERLRMMMKDVRRVARVAARSLAEAVSLLAQEAEGDGAARAKWGTERWTRPSAEEDEGGRQLKVQMEAFEGVLQKAGESDGLVRGKFGEWEGRMALLSGSEAELEAAIPRLVNPSAPPSPFSPQGPATEQSLALRRLRSLLDDLHSLAASRASLVGEAKYAMSASSGDDSIARGAIVREAERLGAGGGEGKEVRMESFEEVVEEELGKFKAFGGRMRELEGRGEDLLGEVKTANSHFLSLRLSDPSLAARESALQELDAAFHMHREILTNLQEGLKFYADLGRMVGELRDHVKEWTARRTEEARGLERELEISRGVEGVRIEQEEPQEEQRRARAWRPEDGIRFG